MVTTDGHEDERTNALLSELERMGLATCPTCSSRICGHEYVICAVMGFKDAPLCLGCLAKGLGRNRGELRDALLEYVQDHPCFRAGWRHAGLREGCGDAIRPTCLWPADEAVAAKSGEAAPMQRPPSRVPRADAEWDSGDMGCGDLVLELRKRLEAMRPAEVLKLTARDPGAPEDIPAWCRLTRHRLLMTDHPIYFIGRKED